jgi:multisubunit Na+/H+ antiporter MnhB subunit
MESPSEEPTPKVRKAAFGALSLLVFAGGVGITLLLAAPPSGANGHETMGYAFTGLVVGGFTCILSLLFAIIGLIRRERPRWPAITGLVLSFLPAFGAVSLLLATGRPSREAHLQKFAEEAKKVINPSDLQNWAIEVLKTNGNVANKDLIPLSIRNLTSQGESISFAGREMDSIRLTWLRPIGGDWGILVGPQTFKPYNPAAAYYIEWQPGVYFYHTK